MKNSRWSDEQIKKWISEFPKVEDSRSSFEIWNNITEKKRKRTILKFIVPSASIVALTAAVTFVVFPLSNSKNEQTQYSYNKKAENAGNSHLTESQTMEASPKYRSIVPNSSTEQIITVGLLDESKQHVVPLSFKGNQFEPAVKQINDVLNKIDVKRFNLSAFAFQDADIYESKSRSDEVIINFEKLNIKDRFHNEQNFKEVLKETFRWQNYKKVRLFTNEKQHVPSEHFVSEFQIKKLLKKAYFLFFPKNSSNPLLVPSKNEYETIEDAMNAMQKGKEDGLEPSINNSVKIKQLKKDDELLTVTFDNASKMKNTEHTEVMLEAILMTAKEFGFKKVKFEGFDAKKIGNIDISKPVEVPFSPNFIDLKVDA